jgi:ribonuclease G
MSKELIISSSRHETKMALLEDDQVVEVFFQREKEYSLAGSIHKGRVTRVLPGMQSAFVDIGLDRDAFLYVSDFFEDNEEYDKIVTSVEDTVLRMEKTPPPVVAEAAPVEVPAEVPESVEAGAEPLLEPAAGGARDDRDKRGRRRRRRTRGKGLPESKFFSPGRRPPVEEAEPVRAEPVAAAPVPEDFAVLPGESLAKYTRRGAGDETDEGDDLEQSPDPAEGSDMQGDFPSGSSPVPEDAEVEPVGDTAAAVSAPEMQTATGEHSGAVEEPAGGARTGAVATALIGSRETLEAVGDTGPEDRIVQLHSENGAADIETEANEPTASELAAGVVDEFQRLPEEQAASEGTTAGQAEAGETSGASPEEESDGEAEGAESADDDEVQPAGESIGEAESIAEDDEVEPARMPTSLTATLREQGGRYGHRVSRRMRRRGGRPAPESGRSLPEAARPAVEERQPERPPRPEPARQDQRTARAERPPQPLISDLLKEGKEILVQIAKEPLGQKGARITSHIALPGRFLVYMPTVEHIGVSRKISTDEERLRLKRILQSNRTGISGGYIVRTAGEGRSEEELRADMLFLYNLWLDMRKRAEKRPAPALIHHDLDLVQRVLRDQLTASFKTIWVDNEEVYESVLSFVQRFQPPLVPRVKLYTRPNPVFDEFGITSELEKALRPKVWLKSGGYIVINQTEALVAIDVNTGKFVGKSNRLEDTIVKTNTDAIREIVRQIRLRDLGGIIVIDFIDMDERKNRQKVMQALEEAIKADRSPNKVLSFNDFGLVAITRKRVKQSLERTLCEPCPYCEGAGYVKSVGTVISDILVEAQKRGRSLERGDVTLRVNPEVAKVLKSSHNTYLQELEETLGGVTVIVKSDPLLHQQKFDLA